MSALFTRLFFGSLFDIQFRDKVEILRCHIGQLVNHSHEGGEMTAFASVWPGSTAT